MLFHGVHESRWRFSIPVFLEPHLVRLTPRTGADQRLEAFETQVTPKPAGQVEIEDAAGNRALRLWFEGQHEELVVRTSFSARTLRDNPFDYLLEPGALRLPPELSPAEKAALAPCLAPLGGARVRRLAKRMAGVAGDGGVPAFLWTLNAWVYANVAVTPRMEPGVQGPEETLEAGSGACRDATLVFMAACRAAGVPARYASCYQQGDAAQDARDLHACAEAYIPGAGWRGFDPTLGLAVAASHLMLCAAPDPALTAPVTGSFRGTGATGELTHRIELTVAD
ncbi:hypothetical protein NNJEOMEG_00924 [Fundidesulfovibrio magnetotacticus]|uniref:Transglutaminase-like domain-containing protein n=1 Tax=Fundidesulfovibrio magnetotacticus TaxID=2730080 RepID=A0A6V8LXU4_9BACT|nr:transglutaminase family protein [Fundidesulfovibrio magnetotacticus]GFK93095.1 hypothetical protein NNJEOMEG_00924 [Fundidesulfovibrio magnetotacticus]